jgi:hypothetical protein
VVSGPKIESRRRETEGGDDMLGLKNSGIEEMLASVESCGPVLWKNFP